MLFYEVEFNPNFTVNLYEFISAWVDSYSPTALKKEMSKIGLLSAYEELKKTEALLSLEHEKLEDDFSDTLNYLTAKEQSILLSFFFIQGMLEGIKLSKNLGGDM